MDADVASSHAHSSTIAGWLPHAANLFKSSQMHRLVSNIKQKKETQLKKLTKNIYRAKDIRMKPKPRETDNKIPTALDADSEESSISGSGSQYSSESSISDDEINSTSLTTQVRLRLSALAYNVQLRNETFVEQDDSKDEIIAAIKKRHKDKKIQEEVEGYEDSLPTGKQCGKMILLVYVAFLALAHLTASIYLIGTPEPFEEPQTCWTPNCRRMSTRFLSAMDVSVSPCDDFYMHVCGKYIESHPEDEYLEGVHPTFVGGIPYQYDGNDKLGMFLKPVNAYPMNQLLLYYKSCMSKKRRDKDGKKPFIDMLSRLQLLNPYYDEISKPSISKYLARIFKMTGKLFFFDVFETIENYMAIGMSKPPQELKTANLTVYARSMRETLALMKEGLLIEDDTELDLIVYLVMHFESDLFLIQTMEINTAYHPVRIFEFPPEIRKKFEALEKAEMYSKTVGTFSWDEFIDEFFIQGFKDKEKPEILFNYAYSTLSTSDRLSILLLEQLLGRTPFYVVYRYFQWSLIKLFIFDLSSDVQKSTRHIILSRGRTDTERCFKSMFANLNVLAAERFNMDIKNSNQLNERMISIINLMTKGLINISQVFPEDFQHWLVGKFATVKVTNTLNRDISGHMGTFYRGLNVSEHHYFANVIQAKSIRARNEIFRIRKMAPYQDWPLGDYSLNEITVTSIQDDDFYQKFVHAPFGGLYEPYVGNDLPIMDLGGFGYWIVGYYIMHHTVFEAMNRLAQMHSSSDSTTASVSDKFVDKVLWTHFECVQEEFATLELPTVPGKKLDVQAPIIYMKALSDTLATELVAKVFKLNKVNTTLFPHYQMLPSFEHYSPEKLLYHSIARQACQYTPKSILQFQLEHGPVPYHLRINGAFRLSPMFSKAWNCPKTSRMNAKTKCQVFEHYKEPRTDWYGEEPPSVESRMVSSMTAESYNSSFEAMSDEPFTNFPLQGL